MTVHPGVADMVMNTAMELCKQQERLILAQFADLVGKGLLEIQIGPLQLVQIRPDPTKPDVRFEMQQSVVVIPKEHEYIKKLESEISQLKDRLASQATT